MIRELKLGRRIIREICQIHEKYINVSMVFFYPLLSEEQEDEDEIRRIRERKTERENTRLGIQSFYNQNVRKRRKMNKLFTNDQVFPRLWVSFTRQTRFSR